MKFQDLIKKMQSAMNAHGASLTVDGDPGPKTRTALEKFDLGLVAKSQPMPEPTPKPTGKPTTGQDSDEGTEPWYKRMFNLCEIDPGKETQVANTLKLIEKGMVQYLEVAQRLQAVNPVNFAYILGSIHFKEASCNFKGVLHNGEKIVGTNKQLVGQFASAMRAHRKPEPYNGKGIKYTTEVIKRKQGKQFGA